MFSPFFFILKFWGKKKRRTLEHVKHPRVMEKGVAQKIFPSKSTSLMWALGLARTSLSSPQLSMGSAELVSDNSGGHVPHPQDKLRQLQQLPNIHGAQSSTKKKNGVMNYSFLLTRSLQKKNSREDRIHSSEIIRKQALRAGGIMLS